MLLHNDILCGFAKAQEERLELVSNTAVLREEKILYELYSAMGRP
jgi:hypothetical protein